MASNKKFCTVLCTYKIGHGKMVMTLFSFLESKSDIRLLRYAIDYTFDIEVLRIVRSSFFMIVAHDSRIFVCLRKVWMDTMIELIIWTSVSI